MIMTQILNNLEYIGAVIFLIFMFQVSNMAFGIADNICFKNQNFDKEKFFHWIIKSLLCLVGTFFLTVGASLIPFVVMFTGISIPEAYGDVVTVAMIITTSYGAVISEAKKAYEHFCNIYKKESEG